MAGRDDGALVLLDDRSITGLPRVDDKLGRFEEKVLFLALTSNGSSNMDVEFIHFMLELR
ncbi:hypothetical protein H5410_020534 [Solanum commersonii]|uniref:Uncharacterized protein n=1 Tax=Solanum commersonii TaxID=4109 RepID=A0A9J5ZA93_SOLCO|nr:hypothetical protein H5410_020534 [Solanum commersonii]